jgi:acetoin utilization deacetylase AcuC-like enzyme
VYKGQVQMGVDGHRRDPMSSIDLSDRFYDSISKVAARCAKENDFPVVLLGGGGFNFPMTAELWRLITTNFISEM